MKLRLALALILALICPSLIEDHDGPPTPFGRSFRSHLRSPANRG